MGTLAYMSPEQAREMQVDSRTDIWSLGVVLHEMLTGHLPFGGATASDILVSVLEQEPGPLTEYLPEAPEELKRIVTKSLRKDREKRYQITKEMLLNLKALKRELEFTFNRKTYG